MKTEEAKAIIVKSLIEKTIVKANEINNENNGQIAFVQIYGIMAKLIKNGSVQMNETDGKKSYTLIDAEKLNDEPIETLKVKPEKIKVVQGVEKDNLKEPKEKPKKKTGRDLTRYIFHEKEFGKSRLALAIITFYCKENNPSHKMLDEVFPLSLVAPYGTWNPLKSAVEKSKERPRFFTNKNEIISTKQGPIAISNQFTTERIEKIISISKTLGYKIK